MQPSHDILDGRQTTVDWQHAPVAIAVLPVGAFEQHGARLPLATDTLFAEHFSRDLAQRLPAALLPALPFASSTEHMGFRGTLSLRPETLMQIVRDLADSLERQRFTRLVIVNGHGGNFFLGPVVRHINAQDRPLKILLADCGREFDRSPARDRHREGELHAGASEISRLLALHPELVRPPSAVRRAGPAPRPGFVRSDLNTFGVGYRHASGVWGDAKGGDAASGAAMVQSIADSLLAHVRERLAWLDHDPRYAGAANQEQAAGSNAARAAPAPCRGAGVLGRAGPPDPPPAPCPAQPARPRKRPGRGRLPLALLLASLVSLARASDAPGPNLEKLLGATHTPRYAQPDARAAEAVLQAVKEDDPPETVYGAWNAFCRTHFGAEAEPDLYARFGEALALNDDGAWRHVSENSAVLAWESNLPAISYVEYGESERYGQKTEPTDRAYYLHLHQLTGLETGRTYHYRLVAVDERGNRLTGPDQTLETRKITGTVYVPGELAGPPYKLAQSNATYVLTRDLTVPGNAITTLRDGITLDLNGHTITFAENATEAKDNYGIMASGTHDKSKLPYQATGLRVLNGTVRQGRGDLLLANQDSLAFSCLKLTGRDIEAAGLRIVYHAPQTWGVQLNHSQGRINAHHILFQDMGAKIVSRHGSAVRTLGFVLPVDSPNAFELHHNLVARTRQNGLSQAHRMYHNEVYVDSWSINSFAMQPESKPGVDAGEHFGNRIFATGFNPYGFGWAHENLLIHDNLIHMHGIDLKARWIAKENWGDIDCLEGVRVTNYGQGGQVRNNLRYWDNLLVMRGGENVELRGTGFYSDDAIRDLIFSNNTVKVEALDLSTVRAACIDPQGHASKPVNLPVTYVDNRLESNIDCARFGDTYGKGNNHQFIRCSFARLGQNPNFHTLVFDGGGANRGHLLLDCTFGPGTAWDDVLWRETSSRSDYSVAWTLALTTVPGATVAVRDAAGREVFAGPADARGRLDLPLTVCTVHPAEWSAADTPDAQHRASPDKLQKQLFAPHTITVRADGKEAMQTLTLDGPRALRLMP